MELSLIVDLITASALILGLIFGLLQLRHYHLSREREADLFLLNSFQTGEFMHGIWLIQDLPQELSKKQLEDKLGEKIRLIHLVMDTWERIGLIVFKREMSINMVDDIYSGPIILSWQTLKKYVVDVRESFQRERSFEWFQWLAERMIDRENADTAIPAYHAYRDWK